MEQIRYLKSEEKQKTREMYEVVFSEDSKRFVDYYYQWKTKDNDILVMEDEAGYEVMMHLNPYQLQIDGKSGIVPYIVAVATRTDCRRQGKMQQVMKRALQDLQKAHCPVAFLLPAEPAYYKGQGFVFVPPLPEKKETENRTLLWHIRKLDKAELQQAAKIANEILAEQYNVYIRRDADYYERLMAETASENGEVMVAEAESELIGILAYGREERIQIKEFLMFQRYEGKRKEICDQIFGENNWNQEEMQMMFRIADLQSLGGWLKGPEEVWQVQVKDGFVEANNGCWQIAWSKTGGSVVKMEEKTAKTGKMEYLDIAEVTTRIMEKWKVFIQEWV